MTASVSPRPSSRSEVGKKPGGVHGSAQLLASMLLVVAAVAALAFWDEERESAAALDDFAQEQATLAGSVASELATRLASARRDALLIAEGADDGRRTPATALDGYTSYAIRPTGASPHDPGTGLLLSVPTTAGRTIDLVVPPVKLLEGAVRVEHPGSVRLFVLGPQGGALRGTDGSLVASEVVQRALDAGAPSLWLGRNDAAGLGLTARRRAAAGLARVDAGPLGRWGVAVVSSAERVRDREVRALWRLALGVLVAAGLVVAFGSAVLRRQRRGLLLERELALSALARERDAELAAHSRAATMGTLAMGVAHEVSTPLGVIAGRAEQLLARTQGDERAARAVQAIIEQADRIRRTVRGFLDLVRGEQPALGDAAPESVVAAALSLVEHRFAAAGVELVHDVSPDLPAIHCDAAMLQQAIVNLLLNACEAAGSGGHVEIKVRSDGRRVAFTVVDDGPGITLEDAARATEPFFTTKVDGHGLGLAITNEIIKLHRGELNLCPASPRGTCASAILPIPAVETHAAA